jgi:hypothetical protein
MANEQRFELTISLRVKSYVAFTPKLKFPTPTKARMHLTDTKCCHLLFLALTATNDLHFYKIYIPNQS